MWASISSPPPLLPPHPRSCFPWKHSALVYRRCCYIIPWLQNNKPPSLSALFFMCMSVIRVLPFLHSCVASDAPAIQFLALLISLRPISRRGRGGGGGGCFAQSLFSFLFSPSLSALQRHKQLTPACRRGGAWCGLSSGANHRTGSNNLCALPLPWLFSLSHTHQKYTTIPSGIPIRDHTCD